MSYYDTLGVDKLASNRDIKKAYHALAKKHHPDINKDADSLAKFQAISEAYDTLSDPSKRLEYDSPQHAFHHNHRGFGDGMDFSEIFRQAGFGDFRPQPPTQKNMQAHIQISLLDSIKGIDKTIRFKSFDGKDETISFSIPAGVEDHTTYRLVGKVKACTPFTAPSDMLITIQVIPDKKFTNNRGSLHTEVSISSLDALTGVEYELTTIDNKNIKVKIPAGFQNGAVLRMRNPGSFVQTGDLFVHVKIFNVKLSDADIKIIEKMKALYETS